MTEETTQTKYFIDKRAACICKECGSYADNSMMVKHYATCTFAEESRIQSLRASVVEKDETIKRLRGLLQEIYDEGHGGTIRGEINAVLAETEKQ